MRNLSATSVLALTVLASVANASFNPVELIKSKLFKMPSQAEIAKNVKQGTWPILEWPGDSQSFGTLNIWNETTQEFTEFANTTVDTYVDATGNREKVITHTVIPDIGFTEIITFFDANTHIAYQKIPKVSQCKTFNLPSEFNLTSFVSDVANETANLTTYEGIVSLPWVTDMTYHKFHVQSQYVNETIFFCTKCHKVKYIINDQYPTYVLSIPTGPTFRVFTDADFDGLTCNNQEQPLHFSELKSALF